MSDYSKFIDLEGQVIKRIFNPARISKAGKEYKIHYLIIKWATGPNGEYVDYVSIKTMEAKQIADIRAGYKVRLTMQYDCSNFNKEPELRHNTYGGVTYIEPKLFPSFKLAKNNVIEILDSKENWEQHSEANAAFEKEVVNPTPEPNMNVVSEDDLPFVWLIPISLGLLTVGKTVFESMMI